MKNQSSRNLLAYFLASKHWSNYLAEKTLNSAYQSAHDPERYMRLIQERNVNPKLGRIRMGITVWDYLYDIYDCVHDTKLSKASKSRLTDEISDLFVYHEAMGTDTVVV